MASMGTDEVGEKSGDDISYRAAGRSRSSSCSSGCADYKPLTVKAFPAPAANGGFDLNAGLL
jgi:hypothetical protein